MKFTDFKFKDYIQEALKEINFIETTEVQEKLIPIVLAGRDLVGESKTGSGKTHTFLLPIFQTLNEDSSHVEVVITAPSRELATQTKRLVRLLATVKRKSGLLTMLAELIRPVRLISSKWLNRIS